MSNHLDSTFLKTRRNKNAHSRNTGRKLYQTELYQQVIGFCCTHCKNDVQSDATVCGVQNRNHCPYCLWSKHVDLYTAGDRLCACKAGMRPLGLAFNKSRNKYGSAQGDLMLIHHCMDCSAFSINRIAADDDSQRLLELYHACLKLTKPLCAQLHLAGIQPVGSPDEAVVYARLFGVQA